MRMRTCVALIVLLTLTASASFAQKIYWTDEMAHTVLRGDLDGVGAPEILFDDPTDGVFTPLGIGVDVSAGKVYWVTGSFQKIQRGNVDGTGSLEDLFGPADGILIAQYVALDVAAGKIYWTDNVARKVRRGTMDGTGSPEDLFDGTDGLIQPVGVALDIAAGKVYWTDIGTRKVQRGNMDGTGTVEDLFDATDGLQDPGGIALDIVAGKIYLADFTTQKIQRGNMDGTGSPEDLFDGPTDALVEPFDVALDVAAGKVYWVDRSNVKIQRGNMDGTGSPEDLFDATDGLIFLRGITLDLPPSADTITPTTTGPTNAASVDFTVTFSEDVVNFDAAADVVITHTGTANTGVTITGGPQTYTVSVTGISGDGSFTLAASTFSDILDPGGNPLDSSVTSAAVSIDNTPPTVGISGPSAGTTGAVDLSYTVTYTGADSVTLSMSDIALNRTGTADSMVDVSGPGTSERTVTLFGIIGDGTLSIALSAGTAWDAVGNLAPGAGPSSTVTVDSSFDTDMDGLSDREEVDIQGTDPTVADTDGDGLDDGDEVLVYLTNPLLSDTDGDGFSDGDEVSGGADPLDNANFPQGTVYVNFGASVSGNGAQSMPYNTLTEAAGKVDSGGVVRILGNVATPNSTETLLISKPMTLEAIGSPVQIGVP